MGNIARAFCTTALPPVLATALLAYSRPSYRLALREIQEPGKSRVRVFCKRRGPWNQEPGTSTISG